VNVAPAKRDSVVVAGEGADSVPDDGGNLAARAADALAKPSGLAPGMPRGWRSGSPSGSR
jgi:4-diphosphocytidyl-2C-methyl-D-erythritol kinase